MPVPRQESLDRRRPAEPPAAGVLKFEAPGPHAKGLAAAGPAPAEIREHDDQQDRMVGVGERALGRDEDCLAMRERQHRERRHEGERDHQQGVVEEGGEPAQESRRLARPGFVIHAGADVNASGVVLLPDAFLDGVFAAAQDLAHLGGARPAGNARDRLGQLVPVAAPGQQPRRVLDDGRDGRVVDGLRRLGRRFLLPAG